ncbi:Alpha-2-macroglobulin-P [Lamellibrachia satsuma]|nr:Alpha-2-macroglobulin-P [Lamellibrachia satsuma]
MAIRDFGGGTMSIAVIFACLVCVTYAQQSANSAGYRLEPEPTYMIVAPRVIRPGQVVQVSITILKLYHTHINVRGSIRMGSEEFASFNERFTSPSTRTTQMQILKNAPHGNYTFRVEGTLNGGISGNIFENETDLIFEQKRTSVFITVNKPIYKQGQKVLFRIIPVKPNLLTLRGSLHVYIRDPTGTVVRRWLGMQTNAGILDMDFQLSDQPAYGTWMIKVRAFEYDYNKTFEVEEFYIPRMYVNVSMPLYVSENSFAVAGVVTANYTSGRPAKGNATLHLEIRPPLKKITPGVPTVYPSIDRNIVLMEGQSSFLFTIEELSKLYGKIPVGQEVHVNVSVYDWFLQQKRTGSAITVISSSDVKMKLLGDYSRSFRPGFPVSLYFAVVQSDGSPLYGDRRQVTINRIIRNNNGYTTTVEVKMIVRNDGIVHYKFVADKDAAFITIRAYYDIEGRFTQAECKMSKVYSKFDNHLVISTSTERPMVNEYMVFTVRTNVFVDTLYYVIVAGGNIIVANRLDMKVKQQTFMVSLSRDMVPSARLLAYYIYDGEVVSDCLNFFVNGTRQNPVNVRINRGKDFSFNTVELTGETQPGAYIAFSGVDYDLYSHGGDIFLTEKDVIEEMETYDTHANHSFGHTWYYEESRYEKVYFPAPSYGIDSNTTFTYAGLLVFTDANATRIPHDCNETRHFLPCNDGSCYLKEQRCDGVMQCEDGVDEMGCNKAVGSMDNEFTPLMKRMKHLTRHYEETGEWLWRSYFVKPDGRIDRRTDVPKEPMSWVVGAFSISNEHGLGVMPQPYRYQATQPFYIQVEMPTHAVKGEQIGVRIALFNYWDRFLECLVTLHDSDEYVFVIVNTGNKVQSSYAPRTTRGDIQTMVYVEAGEMKTIFMPVIPLNTGDTKVTVSATSFMGRDTVSRTINVVYDGVTNYYNTPYLIDLISSGYQIIPDFEIPVPEQFVYPEQRRHMYVPGSAEATVSIVGDVVGPGFFEEHLTAENMLHKPFGSCEQALYNFGANLYYLKFLKTTDQLNTTLLTTTLTHMNLDLQRVLGYMNPDGSFSMFRDYQDHTPSTWLSAIALQTLEDADEADWRDNGLFIPVELRNRIALWLTKQQDNITGAFWDRAPLYDRKMKDNMTIINGVEVQPTVSLTAHVLAALSNSKGITGTAQTASAAAINDAISYVNEFLHKMDDPYQMALVTYALTTAMTSSRTEAFTKLYNMKISSTFTYWSAKPIPENPTRIHNTVPFVYPRLIYPTEARAIEATSYALIVYLRNNLFTESKPIMKWLQTMRNYISGFSATRDSLVALQALSEYGERDTNRAIYDMRVKLESTATSSWKRTINLNKDNWMTTQRVKVPRVFGQVRAQVGGTGSAIMQMQTKVNVEWPEMQDPKPNGSAFYDATIDNLRLHGRNFSIMEMDVCASWSRKDISMTTGLTVLEVELPTGYVIMNDDLRLYVQSGDVPTLRRAFYYSKKVVFYLDYVEYDKKTCVHFRADRWYPVANMTIQHEIRVYDYYEPGMFQRTIYTTRGLFTLHICQVCGSFQCPYCPYYNTATSPLHVSLAVSLTLAAMATVCSKWLLWR